MKDKLSSTNASSSALATRQMVYEIVPFGVENANKK